MTDRLTDILWEKAADFHGHKCPGLAIGVKVCEAAMAVMGITRSPDEEIVCVAENDACGIDAVQALLGCTIGKGNLIYKPRGKMAFTFYVRSKAGTPSCGMRFYLKDRHEKFSREEYLRYLLESPATELFECGDAVDAVPSLAKLFKSYACEICHETTSEACLRLQNGKKICLDCCSSYDRGWQA